jgi:small conductance mechanosensitive channel
MDWKSFGKELTELYLGSVPTARDLAVFSKHVFDSILVLIIAFVLVHVALLIVRVVLLGAQRAADRMDRRIDFATLESLFRSILKYGIYIIALIAILRIWEVDTKSLIVGSAVIGGAIGFGSQGLIQDIITGISLLFENQLNVGDWVDIGGKTGVVEDLGLRAVKIRDTLGQQHIIFNRTIGSVSNYTYGAVGVRADIILPNPEVAEDLRQRLTEMIEMLGRDRTRFRGPLKVSRVGRLESGELWLRVDGEVVPFQQASAQADLERGIHRAARSLAVEIPPENLTVFFSAIAPKSPRLADGK